MVTRTRFEWRLKRAMDLSLASIGLVVLSPVLLAIGLAILLVQGRPIFFRQLRPGLHTRPFTIVKFRTMRPTRPGEVWYRTDVDRVTRLGRFLRSTSLDELPELWNVIKGDMSLVGPRPLLMEYLVAYTEPQRRRHDVRPGITGWAIVHGRHALSFADRLALDTWYVDHWSIRLDIRILALTLKQVLQRADTVATQDVDAIGFPLPEVTDADGHGGLHEAADPVTDPPRG